MMKKFVICVVSLLIFLTIPAVIGNTVNIEADDINEDNEIMPLGTDHFTDCIIMIIGKCNTVEGPPEWKLGIYYPLEEKDFMIQANGQETEVLHVLVRAASPSFYFSHENIKVDISSAKGFFFYAGQSLLTEGNTIFVRCTAQEAWVTT